MLQNIINNEKVLFHIEITITEVLNKCFRIFLKPARHSNTLMEFLFYKLGAVAPYYSHHMLFPSEPAEPSVK